jgi:putative PIN family toxin of toxin-antitoxin system
VHGKSLPAFNHDRLILNQENDITGNVRCVLDTDVIIAAMRSPTGASAALLVAARHLALTMLGTVALALEYEATCLLPEHRTAAGLSLDEAYIFVDGLLALIEPVEPYFLWRPQLRDPGDELVLEAAINGQAAALVTFNRRDFGAAPARFGIELLAPREILQRIRT